MLDLINEIQLLLDHKLYYSALIISFIIPDICSSLSSEDGVATKIKYISWFDKYLGKKYSPSFNGEEAYMFRCSLLHQGKLEHSRSSYKRAVFALQSNMSYLSTYIRIDSENYWVTNLIGFCEDMIKAYKNWYEQEKNSKNYNLNINSITSFNEKGFSDMFRGGIKIIT